MAGFLIIHGKPYPLALRRVGDGEFRLIDGTKAALIPAGPLVGVQVGEVLTRIEMAVHGDEVWVHVGGRTHLLHWQAAIDHYAEGATAETADVATAPMPGSVVVINVQPGDSVTPGQTMMVIESMKLETAIKAPRSGIVETVHVGSGQTFERGAVLVSLAQGKE